MGEVRKSAVASLFYPDDKANLRRVINEFIKEVPAEIGEFFIKKNVYDFFGIIVPHAGYMYSGGVAAYGYSLLRQKKYDTVILIGPSHYAMFEGFGLSDHKFFETPLGNVEVNKELNTLLINESNHIFDFVESAHEKEHSLEVQLPFLQSTLINNFQIVPVLIGDQSKENIEVGVEILSSVISNYNKSVLFVISSDLSHYHQDDIARDMDNKLIDIIEEMNYIKLLESLNYGEVEACGGGAIALLLGIAKKLGHNNIRNLVYRTSGDVSGDRNKVVGYLSAVVW